MTRIWDLENIKDDETPSSESVTIISDGVLTKKISIANMRRVLVPTASTTTLGSVRVGPGLEIDSAGRISVVQVGGYTLPIASSTVLGGIKVGNNLKIDGTGILDTKYPLSLATRTAVGVTKIGDNININPEGEISVTFPDFSTFPDTGIKIGNDTDVTFTVDGGVKPVIKSLVNGTFNIEINNPLSPNGMVGIGLINRQTSHTFGGSGIPTLIPDINGDNVDIGMENLPWNSVYARDLYGNLHGIAFKADTLLVNNSAYRSASTSATPNTIAARDSNADLYALKFHGDLLGIATNADTLKVGTEYRSSSVDSYGTGTADTIVVRNSNGEINAARFNGVSDKADFLKFTNNYYAAAIDSAASTIALRDPTGSLHAIYFNGIATSAQFADLAEKYISDKHYEVGTVVVFGGEEEITVTNIKSDHRVAGVISGDPAYLMNNASTGQAVALRGKVPVKIIGTVKKGDLLITSAVPGYAMSVGGDKSHGAAIFAKSLENKTDYDNGTIIAVIL
jgi:hypothetical protein